MFNERTVPLTGHHKKRTFANIFLSILIPISILLIVGVITVIVLSVFLHAYLNIKVWWFAFAAIPAAWAFFILRVMQRSIYGFIEVVIGIFTIAHIYNTEDMNSTKTALAIAAAIYVIIRGLDNIDQGIKSFCSSFISQDDRFRFLFYWETIGKGGFIHRKIKRAVYLRMTRPKFKYYWKEFERINVGTDKKSWATPYWFARKHYVLALLDKPVVRLCRKFTHFTRRESPSNTAS